MQSPPGRYRGCGGGDVRRRWPRRQGRSGQADVDLHEIMLLMEVPQIQFFDVEVVQFLDKVVKGPCVGAVHRQGGGCAYVRIFLRDAGLWIFFNKLFVSGSHLLPVITRQSTVAFRKTSPTLREGCARAVRTWKSVHYFNELLETTIEIPQVQFLGLHCCEHATTSLSSCGLSDFIHGVVVHRGDEAIWVWRNCLREDPLVRPYRWLRPDLVPPAPFLQCEPNPTHGCSGRSC